MPKLLVVPARLSPQSITTLDKITAMRGVTRSQFIRELVESATVAFHFLHERRGKPRELEKDLPKFILQICHDQPEVVKRLVDAIILAKDQEVKELE